MKVLIIEDEPGVSSALEQALQESGHEALVAADFEPGLMLWRENHPDAVILDLMLPSGDGLELLAAARSEGLHEPVLALTARSSLKDKISGLDGGADDYMAKPFSLDELLARLRALVRRRSSDAPRLRCGDLDMDVLSRRVSRAGRVVFLSSTEFTLLEMLARAQGEPVSKAAILKHVWDDNERDSNLVEVYINYLRHKLERGGASRLIQTVRGKGYVLKESVDEV